MLRVLGLVTWVVAAVAIVAAARFASRHVEAVRVIGGSMTPALESGDVVLVARHAVVNPRDIVLVAAPGHGAVLHRIVGVTAEGAWITRGDANDVADLRPVERSSVVGRVISVLHSGALLRRWREVAGGATLANQSDSNRQ